jgi:FkbM family methyltransferase
MHPSSSIIQTANRFFRSRLSPEVYSVVRRWVDWLMPYGQTSYSQFGEDLFLARRFADKNDGYFVDVGAYHPRQLSNTYALYRRGWRGINIDATPGSMKLFQVLRPRDVNVEAAVSNVRGEIAFSSWGSSPENTAYRPQIDGVSAAHGTGKVVNLSAVPLSELIAKLPNRPQQIDLLNVDVEGLDLEVLRSFDWQSYKPTIVIVEQFSESVHQLVESDLYAFMSARGYQLVSWHRPSLIFERSAVSDAT